MSSGDAIIRSLPGREGFTSKPTDLAIGWRPQFLTNTGLLPTRKLGFPRANDERETETDSVQAGIYDGTIRTLYKRGPEISVFHISEDKV